MIFSALLKSLLQAWGHSVSETKNILKNKQLSQAKVMKTQQYMADLMCLAVNRYICKLNHSCDLNKK